MKIVLYPETVTHEWFAWYPVRVDVQNSFGNFVHYAWVWLAPVWRRRYAQGMRYSYKVVVK
jgi:hypothetical protein